MCDSDLWRSIRKHGEQKYIKDQAWSVQSPPSVFERKMPQMVSVHEGRVVSRYHMGGVFNTPSVDTVAGSGLESPCRSRVTELDRDLGWGVDLSQISFGGKKNPCLPLFPNLFTAGCVGTHL